VGRRPVRRLLQRTRRDDRDLPLHPDAAARERATGRAPHLPPDPFHLPRSGLNGQVSRARFILDEAPMGDRRGVQPHLREVPTREEIARGHAPVMERAKGCGRMATTDHPKASAGPS
jgi:hypothetical protein